LRVAPDGSRVAFGFEQRGKVPALFDLETRTLTLGEAPADLLAPRTKDPKVEGWIDSTSPTLDGKPLALDKYETSRSLAIVPDGQRFVLGTEWSLRLYDRVGRELWEIAGPGVAGAVNITGDGKQIVAGFGDGTIRWYRIKDGQELLAFFPHADRKRWVLWTPSGYYDASPGGEDLIGWHVNRGLDQAGDFFPASRFRSTYYRPDVVAKVLRTLDEAQAVKLADEEAGRKAEQAKPVGQLLPPVVEILSPATGTPVSQSPVVVRFRVRSPADAPATGLRVRVNGQAAIMPELAALLQQPGDVKQISVPIPSDNSEIALFAQNRNEWSPAVSVQLRWAGAAPPAALKPVLYVLAIGISQYNDQNLELEFAEKDALDFVEVVQRQKGGIYRDVVVRHVPQAKANANEMRKGLAWLRREVTANDVGMMFFSGHGKMDTDGRYYFLPVDVDEKELLSTALPKDDIIQVLSSLAGKAVFFMDSCHAGRVAERSRRRGTPSADVSGVLNELSSTENGVAAYASSTGRKSSLEDPTWQNGAFTKALVEGLFGKAAYGTSGKITHQMLGVYLSERVKELTGGRQHPVPGIQGVADFPIAVVR
jgi:hypothetical protein